MQLSLSCAIDINKFIKKTGLPLRFNKLRRTETPGACPELVEGKLRRSERIIQLLRAVQPTLIHAFRFGKLRRTVFAINSLTGCARRSSVGAKESYNYCEQT